MAAGMWQGLLAGYKDVEAKRMAREERESTLLEKRKALALELAMKYGTAPAGGGSPKGGGGGTSGQTVEHLSKVLKTQFDVSDDVISRVAGNSGSGGLNQAFNVLESTRKRYAELGREMPKELINNIFEDSVLTAARSEPIDFEMLEGYIGEALDPLERELISASRPTQAGEAFFPEPTVLPPPKMEDVERLESRATSAITQRGSIEVRNLNEALNKINQAEASETDPQRLSELQESKRWIIDRQERVQDALRSAEGEGGNPFGLVELYGNDFFKKMFEADPRLSEAVLSPVFQDSKAPAPKRFQSREQLKRLARLGTIVVGDVVEVLNPETGEYERQIIGE